MTAALVETPAELESEVAPIVEWAKHLTVTTPVEFQDASDRLKGIKGAMKKVVDFFRPLKQAADENKRRILDAEKKLAGPLEQAESLAKRAMLDYQREEQRKADEQRRKLQAEADERARKEQEAALKKAEAAKKPETKAKYEEQAAAVVAPVIHVEAETPKVSGISTRKNWKATIVDFPAFYRWAIANNRFELVLPNEKNIGTYARSMQEQASMPGVNFFFEEIMSAGSR